MLGWPGLAPWLRPQTGLPTPGPPHESSLPSRWPAGFSQDPGNWATDLAAGSSFGYTLLFVVLCSSLCAMFLQVIGMDGWPTNVWDTGQIMWLRCFFHARRVSSV